MRNFKVWKEGNWIMAEEVREIDSDEGFIEITTRRKMDEKRARTHKKWIQAELNKSKDKYEMAKNALTREGQKRILDEKRMEAKAAKEHVKELKGLAKEYGRVVKERTDEKQD